MLSGTGRRTLGAVIGVLALGAGSVAQALPWVQFTDLASGSFCDVVNAANLELVVLDDFGTLAGITGTDVEFLDTFVDLDDVGDLGWPVYFQGIPAGFIDFAVDADGFSTLWLFTPFGDVANVNLFTGAILPTGLFPSDFFDVPCDACPFWDEPDECRDTDLDGVEDAFDLCPFTLLGEFVDEFGCSCSDFDDDQDGIDNCFDLCPDTPFDLFPEADGCACEELDEDLDGINDCFDLCPGTPFDEFADFDGCSCSNFDDDLDGVSNCFDICPGTSLIATVKILGCAIDVVDDDPVVVNVCGGFSVAIFGLMLFGLVGLRSGVSRHVI